MDQRLSLITLGVGDVSRAQAFYEALGWHPDGGVDDETDHVAFFQTPGSSWRCGTAGSSPATAASPTSAAGPATFWGGYSGVFIDPDGHPGRWPTIPVGPCTRTAEQPSTDGRQTPPGDHLVLQKGCAGSGQRPG
jgi:catechol 2,3-dioxygenase-like lactoylglutathione lyase family enzyme